MFVSGFSDQSYPAQAVSKRYATSADQRVGPAPAITSAAVPMYHTKGTYPRCTRLNDGSLMGAHTAFEDGISILTITRSTNNGASWERIGEVFRGPTSEHDLDNPYVLQLPDGRVLCAFRDHDRHNFGPLSLFRLQVCQSVDGGRNWTFVSTAAQEPAGPTGVWEPLLRSCSDGRSIQMYYSRENSDGSQNNLVITSTDGGKSWSRPVMVADGSVYHLRHGMTGVCETTSPRDLICVMESGGPNGFYLSSVRSSDEGQTWTRPQAMYKPRHHGRNANAPQIVNLGGVLVCSFHTEEDGGGEPGRRTKLITSHDNGNTWANNTTISNSESAWPGLTALGPDSAIVMWEPVGQIGPAAQVFHLR